LVSENRVLRKIIVCTRDTEIVERKGPHNEQLYDLYCSPSVIREIKSRKMRQAGNVACKGGGQVVG